MDGKDIDLEDTLDLTELPDQINEASMLINEDLQTQQFQLRALEVSLIKKHGFEIGSPEADQLFPYGWFEPADFDVKMRAIVEAIEKDIPIIDTSAYQTIIEGVRRY